MDIVRMNQSAGHKPIVLPAVADGWWPEDQIVNYFGTIEARKADDTGNYNNTYRKAEHPYFFLKIGLITIQNDPAYL
jgi:hypothetical protein